MNEQNILDENKSTQTPLTTIPNIKPEIIEQGVKAALSTGSFIRKHNISAHRLAYLQTISFLRRVDVSSNDTKIVVTNVTTPI